jgi:DNA polymerase III subunit beta
MGNRQWQRERTTVMLDRTSETIATAEITLEAGDLHDALARTRHAICMERTRYYLAGVYIHLATDGKTLNFVATDGHRLAHVRVPIAQAVPFDPALVRADFVSEALKMLARKSDHMRSVTLKFSPRSVTLTNWKGERIETEPVECVFPDYARAVPCQPPARAIVGKHELVAALEPIAGFLKPTNQRGVKLAVAGDTLTLSLNVKTNYPYEVAATAQTVVKLAQSADEPYETGFMADQLLEALKTFSNLSSAVVSICSHDFGSPHVIACDSHETYVLMPMRV